MKLSEVIKITGLTKKAIRYYEDKALFHPQFNSDSTYKDYSKEDVSRLNQIAFLRNMDMPVSDIKRYLDELENKEDILQSYLNHIEEKIKRYQDIKSSINDILNCDVDIVLLNRYMIDSQRYNQDFVLRRIAMLFPDIFGKYILVHFGAFMNEPLDTKEKQRAFSDMVEFLDGIEGIEFPPDVLKYYSEIDETDFIEKMVMVNSDTYDRIMSFDENNNNDIEQFRNEIQDYKNIMKQYKKELKPIADFKDYMENKLRETGYYDKFVANLRVISKSYDSYINKCEKINNVVGDGV
jgi:DNA-binding transcriptional MerR regulator